MNKTSSSSPCALFTNEFPTRQFMRVSVRACVRASVRYRRDPEIFSRGPYAERSDFFNFVFFSMFCQKINENKIISDERSTRLWHEHDVAFAA